MVAQGVRTVQDVEVEGRRVLVRVDFNVPLNAEGEVADDSRLRASLPTIQHLRSRGARVVLVSHLGRPKGKVDPRLSMRPVAARLTTLLGRSVPLAPGCVEPEVRHMVGELAPGGVLMLENVRFYPGEEANDPAFARDLASVVDLFVNDAFGVAHRAHASTVGVTQHLPSVAGLLLVRELEALGALLDPAERPFVVVLGGAKVSDKLGVIANLGRRADRLLLGGGLANTFLAACGLDLGDSLVESDMVGEARKVLDAVKDGRCCPVELPRDVVVAGDSEHSRIVPPSGVPRGWRVLDIGPRTVKEYADFIARARTVFWNGPMGVFEREEYAAGTRGVANAVADNEGLTVIGGGDTLAAVNRFGVQGRVTWASTGGGAALEFLEGRELPGLAALRRGAGT